MRRIRKVGLVGAWTKAVKPPFSLACMPHSIGFWALEYLLGGVVPALYLQPVALGQRPTHSPSISAESLEPLTRIWFSRPRLDLTYLEDSRLPELCSETILSRLGE